MKRTCGGYIGRFEEQSICVPCQDIPKGRTQDHASEVPPPLAPTPGAFTPLHERPTPQARNTKQCPQPCVLMVQGAEWPHRGSRDSAPTAGSSGLTEDGGGPSENGADGPGPWGGPWSRWGPEGSHLSADPALRSCSEFTQPSNCCFFIYFFGLFFCVSPSSFLCLSLAPSPAFLFPVCPASQLDITS